MIPTTQLLKVAGAWLCGALLVTVLPQFMAQWWWLGGLLGAVACFDALRVMIQKPVEIKRRLPGRFALGVAGEVQLVLRNPSSQKVRLEIFDGIPQGAEATSLPWRGELPPLTEVKVFYPVTLSQRGAANFSPVQVRRLSPWNLWARQTKHLSIETVKVYPDYERVIRFALLAMQHRENPLGIVRRVRAGTSRDFHQLRDYRDGDPLAQIDWKASSRRQSLISRDYQEQRNQSVTFLLDTGRRMRALDDGLPQFDHILNAILLVAHVALGQGDQVSVKSFGGTDRWLPPIKGAHAMPTLLNHLYDYQTTTAPSDFSAAVESLMARQRRRSLVILLTNLRGEDGKELIPALQILKTRHVVLLASMKEQAVQHAVEQPVESFSSALKFLAADRYFKEREEILVTLGALGVITLDSTAQQIAVALANAYNDIKAAGRI